MEWFGPALGRCLRTSVIICVMDDVTRSEVAECLESLADQAARNPELWQRCYDLVRANSDNELLGYVLDDLTHYSGEFHSPISSAFA
jgi:hypothetical protein